MDLDLSSEYTLSTQLLSDGEPARCVTIHNNTAPASLELLSGSQGGIVSRFTLPDQDAVKKPSADGAGAVLDIQPGGANTRHPHQITAILSSASVVPSPAKLVPSIYITGCKDGNIRVMDGNTHELKFVLEGHSNAVTSLSWIPSFDASGDPWLVSGSWDGTAKIWDVVSQFQKNTDSGSGCCVETIAGHENTVSVAGLPAESSTSRKVVTVSAGVAEGNVIRGHTVRIWRLTPPSSSGSDVKSDLLSSVANDHSGPMRDVCYDAETNAIYTCSNDGTVKIRSAEDGKCKTTLAYPGDTPMLLSVCVVGDWQTKVVVAGAEDGNVVVWDISNSNNGQNREAQVIAHTGCVWKVSPLGNGDFVTACNDGHIRTFTRNPELTASPDILRAFQEAVTAAHSARSSGPSAEEISKLPKWEMNALTQGRSEGQVQVFQKDGKAIAAQWSSSSRTWIEVGEVTGTNANAGTLNGKSYDHVLPIEIDVPGGGVQKLQIGYNNGENPFVTAQQFIDEHMLDQNYLPQIADYIRQRAGESGPTLGGGNAAAPTIYEPEPNGPTPMETEPTLAYAHLPMKGYKTFDAGIDKKGLTKVVQKIREFNNSVTSNQLSPNESEHLLDSLSITLATTNRYHSSTVSTAELAIIHKMITHWDAAHSFPALDLARMVVLHPDASKGERKGYWSDVLGGALALCTGLGGNIVKEVAVPMLTMRLVANSYKGGSGSLGAAEGLVDTILDCAEACAPSDNKNVRLAVATVVLNVSSNMYTSSLASSSTAIRVLDVVGTIVGCGKYEPEAIIRSLVALGTILLLPGECGSEVKRIAKERGIGSMLERVATGHGEIGDAVATEIQLVLAQ